MITSQQAINETLRLLQTCLSDVSGKTGGSHLYGFYQLDAKTFVKFRVADHGLWMQTFISHNNGVAPELVDIISIVYRETPKTPIGTKWKTSGYSYSITAYQYIYPCWDMDIKDIGEVVNELLLFAKTGDFIPPFLCNKDVRVQEIVSDTGIKDITNRLKEKYCSITEIKQYKNMKKTITESQLRDIIVESIKQNLSEIGFGHSGRIEGYNGDPEGAEQWAKKHNFVPDEPHDDAWFRRREKELKDKGVVFEGNYDNIFDDEEAFDNFLRHDFANSPQDKMFRRYVRAMLKNPQLKQQMRNQIQREADAHNKQKYFTPEQAKALGYVPEDYQDVRQEYEVWVKKDDCRKWIKVLRPKKNPSSPSGYSDKYGKPLEESRLRNIIAESINKVLEEEFHHVTVGENPLVKGRYGVHSIPYGDMGHFDGTKKECDDYAPEMEKAAEERFQKDIQHAIEMGMSEEEMNKILHDTYSRRGKFIPSINKGSVSWNNK